MRMRQPKRGVQTRDDHEYAMKKHSSAAPLSVLGYPVHCCTATAASRCIPQRPQLIRRRRRNQSQRLRRTHDRL